MSMALKKRPKQKPLAPLSKIPGINDDFLDKREVFLSEEGFKIAITKASLSNTRSMSNFETHVLHSYKDKLEVVKRDLVKMIVIMAKEHMNGIQLEAFLLSFQYGVNKCAVSRSMKVSRQSIQIRNKRAVRKLKKLIYLDKSCIRLIAEMRRLQRRIEEVEDI